MMEKFDVAIIGAGPIGLACAIACTKHSLSYVVIDKGTLVNSLYNYPLNMTFFSTSERLEIGEVPFISHNPKPTRDEALEYYRRVAMHWKMNTRLYERVDVVKRLQVEGSRLEVGGCTLQSVFYVSFLHEKTTLHSHLSHYSKVHGTE